MAEMCIEHEQMMQKEDQEKATNQIDESLYSRQLYVLGAEAMTKMAKSRLLIININGVGLEVAKCCILAGLRSVTLYEEEEIELSHYDNSSLYLTWSDHDHNNNHNNNKNIHDNPIKKKNRAQSVIDQLSELNPYVDVDIMQNCDLKDKKDENQEKIFNSYDLVILCSDNGLDEKSRIFIDIFERNSIRHIVALCHGVFASLFVNFGQNFQINDPDGNDVLSVEFETIIVDETQRSIELVSGLEKGHGMISKTKVKIELQPHDHILKTLEEDNEAFEIEVLSNWSLRICYKERNYSLGPSATYNGCRLRLTEVKPTIRIDFDKINESYTEDKVMISDFGKISNPKQIIALYTYLGHHPIKNNDIPVSFSASSLFIQNICRSCQEFMKTKFDFNIQIDDKLCYLFVCQSFIKGQLAPMAAIVGSIAAGEVMKAMSNKFTPINQWWAFDAIECMPSDFNYHDESNNHIININDDASMSLESKIFSPNLAKCLNEMKIFLVGSGAIGCELIKLFAMMNVATRSPGYIKVTDMDTIERSNLNRQFLFRSKDVGCFKSQVASHVARQMNSKINILPYTDEITSQLDSKFNVKFYQDLDIVVNALDNLKTRLLMDSKCLIHNLPLLESGTLGTKGNTQVIVPHLTESFGSSQDPPEEQFAICTIKNFPYLIEHTIHWSREFFQTNFVLPSITIFRFFNIYNEKQKNHDDLKHNIKNLLEDPQSMEHIERFFMIKNIKQKQHNNNNLTLKNYEDCVRYSLDLLVEHFIHNIMQMTTTFPKDHMTSNGLSFWSGLKRFPHIPELNINEDKDQYDFVEASAFQLCKIFGLSGVPENHRQIILQVFQSYRPKSFEVDKNVKIAQNDAEMEQLQEQQKQQRNCAISTEYNDIIDILEQYLKDHAHHHRKAQKIEFEKDDDSNLQIQLITASSNIRARSYDIKPQSRIETKRIAGKIIPAINTTTSLVAGLVALELYKLSPFCKAIVNKGKSCFDDESLINDKFKNASIEKFKNSYINLSLPFVTQSEPMHCQIQKYLDDDLKEHTFTIWTFLEIHEKQFLSHLNINENCNRMTLKNFIDFFKEKHSLTLVMLSCGESLLYADFYPNLSSHEHLNESSLVELIEKAQKIELETSQGEEFVILEGMMKEVNDCEYDIPSIKFYYQK